jgi:hypothetical protein
LIDHAGKLDCCNPLHAADCSAPPSKAAFANYLRARSFLKVSDDALGHHEVHQSIGHCQGAHHQFFQGSLFVSSGIALHLSISLPFFAGEAVEKTVSSCFNSGTDSWFYNGSLEVGQDSFYSSYGVGCPEKANLFKMSRASSRGIALESAVRKGFTVALRQYDEELRVIGQALEAKGVTGFELYKLKAGYFIKDLREKTPSRHSTLRDWLRGQRHSNIEFVTYGFELADVEELSKNGRARRSKQGQPIQFTDLSNMLRTIGAYLDSKGAELIELHKRPISMTLVYRDKSGHEYREERPVSSFYSFFLQLYVKRGRTE